jgi:hypothetical protein
VYRNGVILKPPYAQATCGNRRRLQAKPKRGVRSILETDPPHQARERLHIIPARRRATPLPAAVMQKEGSSVKRLIVRGVVTLASLCLFASPAMAQQGGKVLLIIRDATLAEPPVLDWVITKEAGVMKETLEQAGYQVEVASPS